MVKGAFKDLFGKNPFLKSGLKGKARVMRAMTGAKAGTMIVVLACIPILLIISGIFISGGTGSSTSTFVVFTAGAVLQYLAIPPLFYNSVAGERERGSWELLRVAPVSTVQILVGKFAAGFLVLLPWCIFFLGSAVISLFGTSDVGPNQTGVTAESFGQFIAATSVLAAQGLLVAALAMFLSCRMKRPFSALMATYGILAILTMLVPYILSLSPAWDKFELALYSNFLPFSQLTEIFYKGVSSKYDAEPAVQMHWIIYSLVHAAVALGLLFWSSLTLEFPDTNPKFLPKKKDA